MTRQRHRPTQPAAAAEGRRRRQQAHMQIGLNGRSGSLAGIQKNRPAQHSLAASEESGCRRRFALCFPPIFARGRAMPHGPLIVSGNVR